MPELREKPTRFVILAAPRSGSNLLCTMLNSHPDILCHHEVFNPSGIFYALDYRDGSLDLGSIDDRDRAPLPFLERVWSNPLGCRCVGFKMTRGQNEQVLDHVLHDQNVCKIVLRRRNRVKSFVSALIAEQSGQWEVYCKADLILPRPKVNLDLDRLNENIRINDSYYSEICNLIRSSRQSSFMIDYEDLDAPHTLAALLEFLGLSSRAGELVAGSLKQNPTDLSLIVSNYDEVLCSLEGTELLTELCSRDP